VAGFVSSPLLSAPKTVSHEWMHVSDWYPTILNLAGGSTEGITLDGFDQWPAISGSALSPRKVEGINLFTFAIHVKVIKAECC